MAIIVESKKGDSVLGSEQSINQSFDSISIVVNNNDNDQSRGLELLEAYNTAKSLNPSANKRVVIVLPPGGYDLGNNVLVLDTEYIDIVGMIPAANAGTPSMFAYSVIYNTGSTNASAPANIASTVIQTANNIRLSDIEIRSDRSIGTLAVNSSDPAAYYPASNVNNTLLERVIIHATYDSINAYAVRLGKNQNGTNIIFNQVWNSVYIAGFGAIGYGGIIAGIVKDSYIVGNYSLAGYGGVISGRVYNTTVEGYNAIAHSGSITGVLRGVNYISGEFNTSVLSNGGMLYDCVDALGNAIFASGTINS